MKAPLLTAAERWILVVALVVIVLVAWTGGAEAADPGERVCAVCSIAPRPTDRPGPIVVGIPPTPAPTGREISTSGQGPTLTLPPTDTQELAR